MSGRSVTQFLFEFQVNAKGYHGGIGGGPPGFSGGVPREQGILGIPGDAGPRGSLGSPKGPNWANRAAGPTGPGWANQARLLASGGFVRADADEDEDDEGYNIEVFQLERPNPNYESNQRVPEAPLLNDVFYFDVFFGAPQSIF